jgi:hypothetical protein
MRKHCAPRPAADVGKIAAEAGKFWRGALGQSPIANRQVPWQELPRVIPAQAGIQCSGADQCALQALCWIPACAGMTAEALDFSSCAVCSMPAWGNDAQA